MRDPYAILGLPDDASEDTIKAVYRQLARAFHPDVNADASAVDHFREITDAYVLLSDPAARARFDRTRGVRRRRRGEERETRIGLRVAGIDLGGLLGVTVNVRSRPLFDDDEPAAPPERGRAAPRRLRSRRK